MQSKEKVIFDPVKTPNQNWVKELDHRHMDSSFSSFRAPKNDTRIITLCKPFVVFSKNSYSSPVTLPLGLAYLGGVLEKAGYKTKIIDATGDERPIKITRSGSLPRLKQIGQTPVTKNLRSRKLPALLAVPMSKSLHPTAENLGSRERPIRLRGIRAMLQAR